MMHATKYLPPALLIFISVVCLSAGIVHAQDERVPVRLDGRTLFRVGPVADADANSRACPHRGFRLRRL